MASLLELFEERLSVLLGPILKPIHAAGNLATGFLHDATNLTSDFEKLCTSAIAEYNAIKGFKLGGSQQFKNRVILLPRFNESVAELVNAPQQIFHAVLDTTRLIRAKLKTATAQADVGEIEDIAESEDIAELRAGFAKLGGRLGARFAKAGERCIIVLGLIIEGVHDLHQLIADLQAIIDGIKTIRTDFESLDGFFLPQGNKKKTVTINYRKRQRAK